MSQYPYPAPSGGGGAYPGYGGSPHGGNTTGYPNGGTAPLMSNQYTPSAGTSAYPPPTGQQQQPPASPASPYQQRAPSASVSSNAPGKAMDTSMGGDVLFEDGVAQENIPEREMFDFDKYDVDSNPHIQCMLPPKYEMTSKIQFGGQIVVLFNSVTTIMMILTNFKRNADAQTVKDFGDDWIPLTTFIIYTPIAFLLLILLGINNYYSDRIYHDYLMRGIMIDYPNTGEMKYIFKHAKPIIFMILLVVYMLIVVIVLFKAGSAIGTVFTFCLNVGVGVGKYWFSNQSIESQFVSLSDFIMTFPQRDKVTISKEQRAKERDEAVMDESNLKHTAYYMKKVVLNSSSQPCYTDTMRLHRWKTKNYTCMQMIFFHFLVWGFLGALIGACAGYFSYQLDQDTNDVWTRTINPCVETCASVANVTGGAFNLTTCDQCLCSCMHAYQKNSQAYNSRCDDFFLVPPACLGFGPQDTFCQILKDKQCGKYVPT